MRLGGDVFRVFLLNLVFTMEVFLLTKNLLTLLLAILIHGVCALLCARDARFFDLILLWGRTRLPAYVGTFPLLDSAREASCTRWFWICQMVTGAEGRLLSSAFSICRR